MKNNRIYDMDGVYSGQLDGSHVHKSDGSYVGELNNGMILNMFKVRLLLCLLFPAMRFRLFLLYRESHFRQYIVMYRMIYLIKIKQAMIFGRGYPVYIVSLRNAGGHSSYNEIELA